MNIVIRMSVLLLAFSMSSVCFSQKNSRFRAENEVFAIIQSSFGHIYKGGVGYERNIWRFSKYKQSLSIQAEFLSRVYGGFPSSDLFVSPKYNIAWKSTTLSFYPSLGKELRYAKDLLPNKHPIWVLNAAAKYEFKKTKMTIGGVFSYDWRRFGGFSNLSNVPIPSQPYWTYGQFSPYQYWKVGLQVGKYF